MMWFCWEELMIQKRFLFLSICFQLATAAGGDSQSTSSSTSQYIPPVCKLNIQTEVKAQKIHVPYAAYEGVQRWDCTCPLSKCPENKTLVYVIQLNEQADDGKITYVPKPAKEIPYTVQNDESFTTHVKVSDVIGHMRTISRGTYDTKKQTAIQCFCETAAEERKHVRSRRKQFKMSCLACETLSYCVATLGMVWNTSQTPCRHFNTSPSNPKEVSKPTEPSPNPSESSTILSTSQTVEVSIPPTTFPAAVQPKPPTKTPLKTSTTTTEVRLESSTVSSHQRQTTTEERTGKNVQKATSTTSSWPYILASLLLLLTMSGILIGVRHSNARSCCRKRMSFDVQPSLDEIGCASKSSSAAAAADSLQIISSR